MHADLATPTALSMTDLSDSQRLQITKCSKMLTSKRSCQRQHAVVGRTNHHANATRKSAPFLLYCSVRLWISKTQFARLTLAILRPFPEVEVFRLELAIVLSKLHRVLYRLVDRQIPRRSKFITRQRISLTKALLDCQMPAGVTLPVRLNQAKSGFAVESEQSVPASTTWTRATRQTKTT